MSQVNSYDTQVEPFEYDLLRIDFLEAAHDLGIEFDL